MHCEEGTLGIISGRPASYSDPAQLLGQENQNGIDRINQVESNN